MGAHYRILHVDVRPDQLSYLETVLDPAGDLPMTLDGLLAAIRYDGYCMGSLAFMVHTALCSHVLAGIGQSA